MSVCAGKLEHEAEIVSPSHVLVSVTVLVWVTVIAGNEEHDARSVTVDGTTTVLVLTTPESSTLVVTVSTAVLVAYVVVVSVLNAVVVTVSYEVTVLAGNVTPDVSDSLKKVGFTDVEADEGA